MATSTTPQPYTAHRPENSTTSVDANQEVGAGAGYCVQTLECHTSPDSGGSSAPSAELIVDLQSGARCAIRDTGAAGGGRYHWTVTV